MDCLLPNPFLIGTGQTMVDMAIILYKRAHQGQIMAISRRGILPLAHGSFETYPSFFHEMENSTKLCDLFKIVRNNIKQAEAIGIDPRAVIDSLRPYTQKIWMGLSSVEKSRFMRHVFRYWEIIRSRIPPESHVIVQTMRSAGQLEIIAGQVFDMEEMENGLKVHYIPRGGGKSQAITAGRVINCTGPETDYRMIEQPLVKNLLGRGLIRPGPAMIGMDALPGGAVLSRDGSASDILFTLGSTMKGVMWEVVAVPEIRVQAEELASRLLKEE